MTNTLQQAGQAGVRGRILAENEARPVPGRLGLAALATPPRASASACPNRFEREGPNSTLTSRSIQTSLTNPGFVPSWRSPESLACVSPAPTGLSHCALRWSARFFYIARPPFTVSLLLAAF